MHFAQLLLTLSPPNLDWNWLCVVATFKISNILAATAHDNCDRRHLK
jgi:hypothetical protein